MTDSILSRLSFATTVCGTGLNDVFGFRKEALKAGWTQ